MTGSLDLVRLKTQVEAAMETLLRAADARVSWKQQQQSDHDSDAASQQESAYTFLPGVYHSLSPHSAHDGESSPASAHGSAEPSSDGDVVRVVLHGDNSFEYLWTMRRSGPRAMEFSIEMRGEWTKPVLNRSRRGTEDQRVFLCVRKMRFQRLSNYGAVCVSPIANMLLLVVLPIMSKAATDRRRCRSPYTDGQPYLPRRR